MERTAQSLAVNRYLLVTKPIWYLNHRTNRLRTLIMVVPWIIVAAFYIPPVLLYEVIAGRRTIEENTCQAPFRHNLQFVFLISFVGFMAPLIFVGVVNSIFYFNIRQRLADNFPAQGSRLTIASEDITPSKVIELQLFPSPTKVVPRDAVRIRQEDQSIASNDIQTIQEENKSQLLPDNDGKQKHNNSIPGAIFRLASDKSSLRKDLRVAKSLFILVLVFALCWVPFQTMAIISAVCSSCVDDHVSDTGAWLLWANSCLNPVLYPLLHKRFRKALWRIMRKVHLRK